MPEPVNVLLAPRRKGVENGQSRVFLSFLWVHTHSQFPKVAGNSQRCPVIFLENMDLKHGAYPLSSARHRLQRDGLAGAGRQATRMMEGDGVFDRCRQGSLFASPGSLPPTTMPLVSPQTHSLLTGENLVNRQLWRSWGSGFADCLELAFMTRMSEGDTVPRPVLRCWGLGRRI